MHPDSCEMLNKYWDERHEKNKQERLLTHVQDMMYPDRCHTCVVDWTVQHEEFGEGQCTVVEVNGERKKESDRYTRKLWRLLRP